MSQDRCHLLYLLKLTEGRLSASESARAHDWLEDPEVRGRWQRLQQASDSSFVAADGATIASTILSEELIAAFLEESLDSTTAANVEQRCWEEPALLNEVVSTYRFLCASGQHAAVTKSLSDRLLSLDASNGPYEDLAAGPDRERSSRRDRPPEVNGHPTVHRTRDGSVPPRHNYHPTRARRSSLGLWIGGVAAAVCVAIGLTAAIYYRSVNSSEVQVADAWAPRVTAPRVEGEDIVSTNSVTPSVTPSDALEDRMPLATANAAAQNAFPTDDETPFEDESERFEVPRESVGTAIPMSASAQSLPAGNSGLPKRSASNALALQWEQIEGLVVAQDRDRDVWRGAFSPASEASSATFVTLPESWAAAHVETLGKMVLDQDTQVAIEAGGSAWNIAVERGQMALCELAAGTELAIHTSVADCTVRSEQDGTCLGVVLDDEGPRLAVRRGEVTVDSRRVRQGRQMAWAIDGFGNPGPVKGGTSWFEKPERVSRISESTRDRLLASSDVRQELVAMRRSDDLESQLVSTRLALTMFPAETFSQTIEAADRGQRMETLYWIMSLKTGDPRLRSAWKTLAERSGDAAMVRKIIRWRELAERGARVERSDAADMLRGLNHDNLAVRQISVFFLEAAFGRRAAYLPDAAANVRARSVREWTAVLRKLSSQPTD